MKCPNCNSYMFLADQSATPKSLVCLFRCSNCVSEHVSSKLLSADPVTEARDLFAADSSMQAERIFRV